MDKTLKGKDDTVDGKKMKPTEAQIKEFWEWCGFVYDHWGDDLFIVYPDDKVPRPKSPAIDPNNLFRYAVPKLKEAMDGITFYLFDNGVYEASIDWKSITLRSEDKDPALALFWAIWEVIKK